MVKQNGKQALGYERMTFKTDSRKRDCEDKRQMKHTQNHIQWQTMVLALLNLRFYYVI